MYQPGDRVRGFAPVAWEAGAAQGTPAQGPYYAYLLHEDDLGDVWAVPPDARPVTQVRIRPGPQEWEGERYGPNGAILNFRLPHDASGDYVVLTCNIPCGTSLGDITYGFLTVEESPPAAVRVGQQRADVDPEPGSGLGHALGQVVILSLVALGAVVGALFVGGLVVGYSLTGVIHLLRRWWRRA